MLRTSGKNSSRANKCFGNYLFESWATHCEISFALLHFSLVYRSSLAKAWALAWRMLWNTQCWWSTSRGGLGWVLPMKDFTERLLAFLGFRFIRFFKLRYMKGKRKLSFIYLKGPWIKQKHLMAVSYNLLGTTRSPHKNGNFLTLAIYS